MIGKCCKLFGGDLLLTTINKTLAVIVFAQSHVFSGHPFGFPSSSSSSHHHHNHHNNNKNVINSKNKRSERQLTIR